MTVAVCPLLTNEGPEIMVGDCCKTEVVTKAVVGLIGGGCVGVDVTTAVGGAGGTRAAVLGNDSAVGVDVGGIGTFMVREGGVKDVVALGDCVVPGELHPAKVRELIMATVNNSLFKESSYCIHNQPVVS